MRIIAVNFNDGHRMLIGCNDMEFVVRAIYRRVAHLLHSTGPEEQAHRFISVHADLGADDKYYYEVDSDLLAEALPENMIMRFRVTPA